MRKAQMLGKSAASNTIKMLKKLYGQPIVGIADVVAWTGYTRQGAYKVIERLEKLGILKPLNSPSGYGQRYIYQEYYELFNN